MIATAIGTAVVASETQMLAIKQGGESITDTLTIRVVVVGLAALTALAVVGAIVLQLDGEDGAQAWQLASMLGGALAGILVNTRSGADPITAAAVDEATFQAHEAGAATKQAEVTAWIADGMPQAVG